MGLPPPYGTSDSIDGRTSPDIRASVSLLGNSAPVHRLESRAGALPLRATRASTYRPTSTRWVSQRREAPLGQLAAGNEPRSLKYRTLRFTCSNAVTTERSDACPPISAKYR